MQWKRPPATDELDGLITGEVRERILAREAMKLGLDQDDAIVRRRLAQKLEFLLQDVATILQPTEDELARYFAKNRSAYDVPAQLTFSHIYFSSANRSNAEQDAKDVLQRLRGGDAEGAAMALSDPFLLDIEFQNRPLPEIEQTFGREFSAAVASLTTRQLARAGTFNLRLASGEGRNAERRARADIGRGEGESAEDLAEDQRRRTNDEVFERLKSGYVIVVHGRDTLSPAALQPVASKADAR